MKNSQKFTMGQVYHMLNQIVPKVQMMSEDILNNKERA